MHACMQGRLCLTSIQYMYTGHIIYTCIMEEDVGLLLNCMFYHIIPKLFPCFLTFCYVSTSRYIIVLKLTLIVRRAVSSFAFPSVAIAWTSM